MNKYMQILALTADVVTEEFGVIQTLKTGRKKTEENSLGIPGPKKLMNSSTTTPFVFFFGHGYICTHTIPHENLPTKRADYGEMHLQLQTQENS